MKVRAKQLGFYGGSRKRPGEVFIVEEKDFSARWMESLEGVKKEVDAEPEQKPEVKRGKRGKEAKSSGDAEVI